MRSPTMSPSISTAGAGAASWSSRRRRSGRSTAASGRATCWCRLLAGREEGSLELFEAITFHGLSTASAEHAVAAEQAGVAGRRVSKPVTTLAKLCAEHAPPVIDVLKIDVEGHEAEVLGGADFARWRPRVILVEAIEPLSMADSSQRFEPMLLGEGYRFAFFDNLNRWYVAEEEAGALLPRFPRSRCAGTA